jgi:hypothetical protein
LVLIAIAAYAIWRGLRRETSPQKSMQTAGAFRTYAQFLGITLINPLTVVYFTAPVLHPCRGKRCWLGWEALRAIDCHADFDCGQLCWAI